MDHRFATRREELRADAELAPQILRGLLPRLERFLDPFLTGLQRSEQDPMPATTVAGLISNLEYKNVESIAYLHDQPREPLQQFIGQSPWDHCPMIAELGRQVGQQLGSPTASWSSTPPPFPRKARLPSRPAAMVRPAGQGRQLPGRRLPGLRRLPGTCPGRLPFVSATRVDTATAAVVTRPAFPARSAFRRGMRWLWKCCRSVGRRYHIAGSLATMKWAVRLDFRRDWRSGQERYLLAVPSNTLVRDLEAEPPPYHGRAAVPVPSLSCRSLVRVAAGDGLDRTDGTGRRQRAAGGASGEDASAGPDEGRRVGPEEVLLC